MKVALVDVDSHNMPNLALMKISAWHKKQGDEVKVFDPLWDKPDTIYASKVFDFTPGYEYYPDNVELIFGGSGYGLDTYLPDEIERYCPDYEIFDTPYALGFTTRGCIRKCPFCIVPEKEGKIREVSTIDDFWRGQDRIVLLDNNLTALPVHFEIICSQIISKNLKCDFSQGLDIRFIDKTKAQILSKVKTFKRIHFAFDTMAVESAVRRGIKILTDNGVPKYRLMFYVLIGFDTTPEEDLYRVELLRSLGVDSFVMPYDKHDPYQRRFARWTNHKAVFKSVKWEEYVA